MKKTLAALAILGILSVNLKADPLKPFGFIQPVTQNDGDSVVTTQVSCGVCPGSTCPTLLSASQTGTLTGLNRTSRRRQFVNLGAGQVFIGSSAVNLTTIGYAMGASTSTYPSYSTYDTAAIYCTSGSTVTVTTIQEYNSQQ